MPNFDIVRTSKLDNTFRVAKVKSDFDFQKEEIFERFTGEIRLPDQWSLGLIVGNSGTGKTTIARELFGDDIVDGYEYTHASVIDDMPQGCTVDEITKTFYAVGFGSVPSWLKPYRVLSNGEKMRVDVARSILGRDFTVFDEFTSVVDRDVAKTLCVAVAKSIRRSGKKFVAVSCHKDIIEYLQPDWVFDTDKMTCFFPSARDLNGSSRFESAGETNGRSLASIII